MACTCSVADGINAGHGAVIEAARAAAATMPFSDPYPVPEYPPRSWFYEEPEWFADILNSTNELEKIKADDQGRVAGVFYPEGHCLVHDPSACPGPSPTFYAAFHQSEAICEDGAPVRCGVIGDVGGHADPFVGPGVAQRKYSDPGAALVMVRAFDKPGVGGVILGSVIPGKTYGDVAKIWRHPLSGDWRPMPQAWWDAHGIGRQAVVACEGYDCIGPTFVNRGGLPLAPATGRLRGLFRRFTQAGRAAAILGGIGGVQIGDEFMGETKIEIPGGITVTQSGAQIENNSFGVPGPQPTMTADAAILAAGPTPPGPPGGPPQAGGDSPPADGAPTREEFNALSDKVDALMQAMDQMMQGQMAAMEASLTPLPEPVNA